MGGGFIPDKFGISTSFSSKYLSADQNMVSRFHNSLAKIIQEKVILPKWIVIIPDDDLIRFMSTKVNMDGLEKLLNGILNHIMSEYNKLILAQKDFLPNKARKLLYLQIVWMEAPVNCNFMNNEDRLLFNACLNTVAKFHENTLILGFKKIWDPDSMSLFLKEYFRFTTEGLTRYWAAVDCTLRYAETILWKKQIDPPKFQKKFGNRGKYIWNNPQLSANNANQDTRRFVDRTSGRTQYPLPSGSEGH